jgi:hypothetical protein
MDTRDFDELAGRIEGIGRAVITLAWVMERETDMDGHSLTRRWRAAVPSDTDKPQLVTARRTLEEMALHLDQMRAQYQERLAEHRRESSQ